MSFTYKRFFEWNVYLGLVLKESSKIYLHIFFSMNLTEGNSLPAGEGEGGRLNRKQDMRLLSYKETFFFCKLGFI